MMHGQKNIISHNNHFGVGSSSNVRTVAQLVETLPDT